jgi:adhesin transport system outer membrane protein
VRGALPTLDWGLAPPTIPPRLVDAISLATQKNPAVAAAWFGVRASHADLRSAKWRRFPTLTTQVNTWSAGANRTAPSLQLGMPIYTFGRIGAAIDKAEADQSLAVAAWRQRVVELALTTSQTYYQYLLASRRTQILRAGVEEHRKLVASMERRVEQEVSPLADLELARTRLAQMQQDLSVAASQADTSLAVLRELIQDPEFDPGEPPAFAPQAFSEDWSGAPAEAVEYDPGRERLRAQALAASREISASRAAIFPQVDAVYSYDDFYGSRVGLALKVQSAGLSQFSQVSGAQARYSQALSQVGDLERQLRQEVSTQVIQNQAARERTSLSSQASDTASRVSGSYVRQFITGRRSWLDVMNALRESVGAQLSETDAAYTVMITNSQLYLRTGKWQPQLQEEER